MPKEQCLSSLLLQAAVETMGGEDFAIEVLLNYARLTRDGSGPVIGDFKYQRRIRAGLRYALYLGARMLEALGAGADPLKCMYLRKLLRRYSDDLERAYQNAIGKKTGNKITYWGAVKVSE